MARTLAEINQDYANHCGEIGHKIHQIRTLNSQIQAHQGRLLELEKERAECVPTDAPTDPRLAEMLQQVDQAKERAAG